MSASLVGSEMCIRDSTSSRIPGPRPRAQGPVPRVRAAARHLPRGARRPVSYTHLTLPTICSV
eukprot:508020-Alexandrium_andersonii.AAC.1